MTTTQQAPNGYDRMAEALKAASARKAWTTATPGGSHVRPTVTVDTGTIEYRFQLGRDERWRWTSISTWGNDSFINGPGCDASGYVLGRDHCRALAALLHARLPQ